MAAQGKFPSQCWPPNCERAAKLGIHSTYLTHMTRVCGFAAGCRLEKLWNINFFWRSQQYGVAALQDGI